jgi:hypothetical protein
MARSKKIRRAVKTEAQLVAEKGAEIGVPAAQIARGGHQRVDVKLDPGERAQTLKTLVNRGGTAVDRWYRDRLLTDLQIKAIEHCQALWERAATVSGLVANPMRVAGHSNTSGWAQQEALDDLASYKRRVPAKYWDVFENVCRWDEPAGAAGSSLATNSRAALVSARICVAFVADLIVMWRGL